MYVPGALFNSCLYQSCSIGEGTSVQPDTQIVLGLAVLNGRICVFVCVCVCFLKTSSVLGNLSFKLLTFNFPMPQLPILKFWPIQHPLNLTM